MEYKELELEFVGRGETGGFVFKQIMKSDYAYIYQVQPCVEEDSRQIHYEVFVRKKNDFYGTVTYPKANSFGILAWTFKSLDSAKEKFNQINTKSEEKAKESCLNSENH